MKNLFNKIFRRQNSGNTVKNKAKWRHGGYAAIITAVAIIAVIVLNVLLAAIAERTTLSFDLTPGGENSISAENAEFIKGINSAVTVSVLADKSGYTDGYMAYYAENYKGVTDETGAYFKQTVRLVDTYESLNKNIKVEYIDISTTAGAAIANEYPTIFYGDIVVRGTNAQGVTHSRLVSFEDIYSYSDPSGYAAMGYGAYSIDGNNIETALTSAINGVLSGETKKAGLLCKHSESSIFSGLYESQLKLNNFEIADIEDNIISKIDDDIDVLFIVAPTSDFLPAELNVINAWLDNNGNRGHSLVFFPAQSVAKIPNLLEFLAEWGIKYTDGVLWETNSSNHMEGDNTTMAVFDCETELSGILPDSGNASIVGGNIPMEVAYETHSSRTTNLLVSTSDTVTAAPLSKSESWKPAANAVKKSYANLIVTQDTVLVDNKEQTSYVAAFSSADFIYSAWAQYEQLENMDIAVKTAIKLAGFENETNKTFVVKTVTTESFADSVTATKSAIITAIFVIILPLALIAYGVVVYVKRRKR